MEVKEVIEIIEDTTWIDGGEVFGKINHAKNLAIEALEKQIPGCPNPGNEHIFCPACARPIEGELGYSYCHLCGQKLDWSDY